MNEADLFRSAFSGALIVISGGLYALLLALGHLQQSQWYRRGAALAYLVLVICSFVLAASLGFSRAWYIVIAVMLVGYLLAPKAIWHLTHATHSSADR
jgi:hypothetical protein